MMEKEEDIKEEEEEEEEEETEEEEEEEGEEEEQRRDTSQTTIKLPYRPPTPTFWPFMNHQSDIPPPPSHEENKIESSKEIRREKGEEGER